MSTVALAGYRPHKLTDLAGYAIAAWTRSPYSHCEVVIDDICYSSSLRDGGVRAKRIDLSGAHWDVVPAPRVNVERALAVFATLKDRPYGYFDLVSQHVLRMPVKPGGGVVCSDLCAAMLGLPRSYEYSPGSLMALVQSWGV